jgi:hypothetical protein
VISKQEFYKGRDVQYAADLTNDIRASAEVTMLKAALLLEAFGEQRGVTSGWRPAAVNMATANAATHSRHMTGEAIDLEDKDGRLDDWCLQNPEVLVQLGLWQEHPTATVGWCHVQTVPPRSGHRVFYP